MKNLIITLFITLLAGLLKSQTTLVGTVKDQNGESLAGVNVYIKNSFDGISTGADGNFKFTTNQKGQQFLVASFIGYNPIEQLVELKPGEIKIDLLMKESKNQIGEVTISAGSFEAGEERKAVVLNSLDIVSTASATADIYAAMRTLPGASQVAEDGRLFVRGGDATECATFIDGLRVQKPYFSNTPDIPVRGRFSPFLFSGMTFSTGGYSAEYGQAMSSALILRTQGLPEDDEIGISIMSLGLGSSVTKRWENSSLALGLEYMNLGPYLNSIKPNTQFTTMPESAGTTLVARQRTGKTGMIKLFSTFNVDRSSVLYPTPGNENAKNEIGLTNQNLYSNLSYSSQLTDTWQLNSGISFTNNMDKYSMQIKNIDESEKAIQTKVVFIYHKNNHFKINSGVELGHEKYKNKFQSGDTASFTSRLEQAFTSMFAEVELKPTDRIAIQAGIRAEYSNLLHKSNISPRFSMAYALNDKSQLSLAAGRFYQNPSRDMLLFAQNTGFEHADHYILNYQYIGNSRIFRIEPYYKIYRKLLKTKEMYSINEADYSNSGSGYARGIDIFWRDQKSFKYADYWVSYSYIDSKREYRDYPEQACPPFVTKHNFSLVAKYFVAKLSTQFGLSASFNSGHTYYNPNNTNFLSDKTKAYSDLSVNASYLTNIFGQFTIVHASVTNLAGTNPVFTYRYAETPGSDGIYPRYAVKPMTKRFFFLGIFITLK